MGIFWTKYASIRELMRLGPVRSCWWMFVPKYSSFVSSKWKISRSSFVALSRYCSPLDLTNKTVIRNSLRCRPASPDKILPLQQPEMRGKITPNLCLDKLKISQPLSLNWPSREWENKTKPCWLSVCLQSVCQDIFKLWHILQLLLPATSNHLYPHIPGNTMQGILKWRYFSRKLERVCRTDRAWERAHYIRKVTGGNLWKLRLKSC